MTPNPMKRNPMRRNDAWMRTCGLPVAAVTAAILFVMPAAPGAQRGRRGGAGGNAGVPIATNTILENPGAYYGRAVTISAGVEQMLSKTAFLVDQRKVFGAIDVKAIGKPILVIAPYLSSPLDPRGYVLVSGELMELDAATIPGAIDRVAAEHQLDLPLAIIAKYQGQPVLLATSVINAASVDVARKPLPPPSAEEASLIAAMKTIGPAFATIRAAVDESKADVVTANAAKIRPAFTQAEAVWDNLGQSAPAEWAREAHSHSASLESAAAAGNWDAVKTSASALNQLCQTCHAVYRDRLEDGTFRIKAGTF